MDGAVREAELSNQKPDEDHWLDRRKRWVLKVLERTHGRRRVTEGTGDRVEQEVTYQINEER